MLEIFKQNWTKAGMWWILVLLLLFGCVQQPTNSGGTVTTYEQPAQIQEGSQGVPIQETPTENMQPSQEGGEGVEEQTGQIENWLMLTIGQLINEGKIVKCTFYGVSGVENDVTVYMAGEKYRAEMKFNNTMLIQISTPDGIYIKGYPVPDCDWIKLSGAYSYQYLETKDYEAELNMTVKEWIDTTVLPTSNWTCELVPYEETLFKPDGKICDINNLYPMQYFG